MDVLRMREVSVWLLVQVLHRCVLLMPILLCKREPVMKNDVPSRLGVIGIETFLFLNQMVIVTWLVSRFLAEAICRNKCGESTCDGATDVQVQGESKKAVDTQTDSPESSSLSSRSQKINEKILDHDTERNTSKLHFVVNEKEILSYSQMKSNRNSKRVNPSHVSYILPWVVFLTCVTVCVIIMPLTFSLISNQICLFPLDVTKLNFDEDKHLQCIQRKLKQGNNNVLVDSDEDLIAPDLSTPQYEVSKHCKAKVSAACLKRYLKLLMKKPIDMGSDLYFVSSKEKLLSTLFLPHTPFMERPRFTISPFTSSVQSYVDQIQVRSETQGDQNMLHEIGRLMSFCGSSCPASPIRLAESGFYATGAGPQTRCFSCRTTYSDWRIMDTPHTIHRRISPQCAHLIGSDDRNIPIHPGQRTENIPERIYGVIQEYPRNASNETPTTPVPRLFVSDERLGTASLATTTPTMASTPSQSQTHAHAQVPKIASAPSSLDISHAVYPQYRDLQLRMNSYLGWGWSHVQDPKVLSGAGFFYAGYRDCVRCFYCGVGLRTWEKEDDPWVIHIRWRCSCDFVRCMKGEQFVIEALAGHNSSAAASPLSPLNNSAYTSEETRHIGTSVPGSSQSESTRGADPARSLTGISSAREVNGTSPGTITETGTSEPRGNMTTTTITASSRNTNSENNKESSGTILQCELEEENHMLRDESTCKVCLDNPSCIVFLPCGHLVTCAECAPALRKCPVCRALIRGTVRAYTD